MGDVLTFGPFQAVVAATDRQRTRSCLTGCKLDGLGSIAVLVDTPADEIRKANAGDRLTVTWGADTPRWFEAIENPPAFHRLNTDWNAHPNAPDVQIHADDAALYVRFRPNAYMYRAYSGTAWVTLRFADCSRYRQTPINDHGWYGGKCRFSGAGLDWGEFYEITGETADARDPTPWVHVAGQGTRHFHFYFRDDALEVKARDWSITREEADV
ncbi:hypothetical protein [Actibacterium ureilyticum]|uniref:hypothetical protein n=1 Tax=Actibacterium ureilyticum TaxID=1590614 RepID=UPI001140C73A|nr:hypothetical protein [Actibacterium ureilyticum]